MQQSTAANAAKGFNFIALLTLLIIFIILSLFIRFLRGNLQMSGLQVYRLLYTGFRSSADARTIIALLFIL